MLTKLKTIRHSTGFQQSAISISSSLAAAGLSAIATIIITRRLGPEQFGLFSVGFSLTQILIRTTDFGMTTVVQRFASRESDQRKINRIFSFTTKIRLFAWLVLVVIGLVAGPTIASSLNFGSPAIIILAFVLAGATSFYEHFQAMLQSLHLFAKAAAANVTQALLKLAISLSIFFVNSFITIPVFFGYMVAPIIPYFFFRKFFPNWVRLNLLEKYDSERKTISGLATHSAIAFMSAGIIENVDVLFVQRYLTTYEAGLLGGVTKVALLFSVVAYALGNVLNTRVSRYKEKKDISRFLQKAAIIAAITLVGYLTYLPFSKIVLMLTIGSDYLPAISTMNILVASSFLTIAVVPFIALFFSFEKPWYFSVAGILQLLIIIIGNMVFVPLYGLEAAAWTRVAARVSLLLFTVLLAIKTYRGLYGKVS